VDDHGAAPGSAHGAAAADRPEPRERATAPRVPAARIEVRDAKLSTDRIDSAEPIAPMERNDPTDPIEQALPTERIERNEDSEPMLRNEFFEPIDQREPSELLIDPAGRRHGCERALR
jgi:hypothetical protein